MNYMALKVLRIAGFPLRTGVDWNQTGNLVSCPTASMPVVAPLLADYTEQFADKGIAFEVLCHCAARTLVLVYQPQQLEDLLQKQAISCYLQELGIISLVRCIHCSDS